MDTFIGFTFSSQFMARRKATDVFSEWAEKGRDEGMEHGHSISVDAMLELAVPKLGANFSAIDVGCGNGWVCRKLANNSQCSEVVGIDGSNVLISKAKEIDPGGEYLHALLPEWRPQRKFDFIHSMEFLYYLENPSVMLAIFYNDWLENGGMLIAGIDYYLENEDSHDWPEALDVHMTKLSIQQWKEAMIDAGFSNVEMHQVGKKENFIGTLVMLGIKLIEI